jgi:hypothetical protein
MHDARIDMSALEKVQGAGRGIGFTRQSNTIMQSGKSTGFPPFTRLHWLKRGVYRLLRRSGAVRQSFNPDLS